jgi:GYF domain 2
MSNWFYNEDNQQAGPVSDSELHALVAAGRHSEVVRFFSTQRPRQDSLKFSATGRGLWNAVSYDFGLCHRQLDLRHHRVGDVLIFPTNPGGDHETGSVLNGANLRVI